MNTKRIPIIAGTFLLALVLLVSFVAAAGEVASLSTDKPNYAPEETVHITGSGFLAGSQYALPVLRPDGSLVKGDGSFAPGWDLVSADAGGNLAYDYQLDGIYGTYEARVYPGDWSGDWNQAPLASVTFMDAPSANIDQCANGQAPSPSSDGCDSDPSDWVNGNLGASKAVYYEGDSIPYRFRFDDLGLSSHTVTFEWDTTKSGKHALDYLTSYTQTVETADACLDVTGCSTYSTYLIPLDPQVTDQSVIPIAGYFTLYGGTITSVSPYSYADGTGFTGDKSARITVTFTAEVANPVLAWGGHISSRADWGLENSAVAIPGSPYHMRLIGLDGKGGNQDRSLSAAAVIFPGSITIIKEATPEGSTSFPFTASPSPLADFSLVDDGTSTDTHVFGGITDFKTYLVTENMPTGWDLTDIGCSVTSANGGSQTINSPGVSINLKEGENVTCIFSDERQPAHLIVIKHVINDDGGTALASDFTMSVTGNSPSPASFPGAESPGTDVTLEPGAYSVGETGPSGYSASYSTDCSGSIDAGQTKTCTVTNNDQPAYITVIKVVNNTHGGSAVPNDFNLTLGGSPVTSGVAVQVNPGTYTASETLLPGYTFNGFSGECDSSGDVTVALGQSKTCTLTNSDQQAYITVVKVVNNTHGGTALPNDFNLTLEGSPVTSGVAVPVNPGTYTAGETLLPGYTFNGFSGDCNSSGDTTVALGESKTCTLTNSDQQAYITVVKVVNNTHGGSALPNDFNLTLEGSPATSGVAVPVNPGTYTAGETLLPGYTFDGFSGDCNSSGDTTVALGESKTCTLTNSDQQAFITVVKVVNNTHGGSALPNDFNLTLGGSPVTSGVAVPVNPGTYRAAETLLPGYTFDGFSGDCDGHGDTTVALGESKTCTLTNSDQQAYITVIKVVNNDNGGMALPDDFNLTLEGVPVTSGVAVPVNPGTYTAGETLLPGYAFDGFSGDCDSSGDTTVALGESKTCTLTNHDLDPTLKLVKTVDNGDYPGGTAIPDDWTLYASRSSGQGDASRDFSNAGGSGAFQSVFANAGYDLSESDPSGYDPSDWICDGGTLVGSTITLALDEDVTCTINNTARGMVSLLKLTNGFEDPVMEWNFSLEGPEVNVTDATPPALVDFGNAKLIPGETYRLCETGIPVGWLGEWKVDTDHDGIPDTVIPFVPEVNDDPVGPNGYSRVFDPNYVPSPGTYINDTRCVNFVVGIGETLNFQIDNRHPGGEPRTIGYWKNWNTCTHGHQAETAAKNGGPAAGWYLLDDLLEDPGYTIGILDLGAGDCEQGVDILDKRDLNGKKKASDGAYNLAAQLLAAELNLSAGAESCQAVVSAVEDAQNLLFTLNFDGTGTYLSPQNKGARAVRNYALYLADILDQYNNGLLCSP